MGRADGSISGPFALSRSDRVQLTLIPRLTRHLTIGCESDGMDEIDRLDQSIINNQLPNYPLILGLYFKCLMDDHFFASTDKSAHQYRLQRYGLPAAAASLPWRAMGLRVVALDAGASLPSAEASCSTAPHPRQRTRPASAPRSCQRIGQAISHRASIARRSSRPLPRAARAVQVGDSFG